MNLYTYKPEPENEAQVDGGLKPTWSKDGEFDDWLEAFAHSFHNVHKAKFGGVG